MTTTGHGAADPSDPPSLRLVPSAGSGDTPSGAPTPAGDTATPAPDSGAGAQRPGEPRDTIDASRELLGQADPAAYYKSLTSLVRSSHSSILQELPYTPSLSFHDPTVVVVEPEPTNIETVELYARAAYPDFDKVLRAAFAAPEVASRLTELFHLLVHEGANVALVTNHGQIIDIALVIGALDTAMLDADRTFGVLGERATLEDMAERTNVLVSRMVATRQAFSVPAVQVLQSAARTFLTMPQTASRRRAKLDPELVRANNRLMRHELDERLARGGQLLAMAASGSQDLALPETLQKMRTAWRQRRGEDPGQSSTLHFQPLYDGTISLMRSCRYVLPVAICLDPATPACEIGSITRIRSAEDCHLVMDWIALAHQEATGTPTIYHWHEDDLLTQVRAFLNRSGTH